MRSKINQRRVDYAFDLARRIDTVAILACDEFKDLVERCLSGEFDADVFVGETEMTSHLIPTRISQ